MNNDILVRVGADISDFSRKLNQASKTMEKTFGKIGNVGKTMSKFVTAPIVGLGVASIVTGAKFDKSMSAVQAVTGSTGKEFDALRKQAMELGSATVYSASEAAEGMEMLGRAGFSTEEIMATMPGMLDLAASGALELGEAADITSNILSGFGMDAKESGHLADVLALAAASANTDVQGLGEAFKYVGPVASGLGVSLEDTAAAIGILGDAGIQSGQAGNMLKRGLLNLSAPSKQAKDLMEELGIEVFDAEGNMKSMPEVIKQLENGMGDMTKEQKTAAMSTLFGAQAVSGWMSLVDAGSDSLGKFTGKLEDSAGSAEAQAEVMRDNLSGSFTELMSMLELVGIQFSDVLKPAVKAVTEAVIDFIQWFSKIGKGKKQLIVIGAAIAALIGPLLVLIGFIPTIVAGFGAIAAAIGAISLPVVAVVAGIAALVAGLIYAWNTSEAFRDIVTSAFEYVREIVTNVIGEVVSFVTEIWGGLVEFWQEHGQMILEATRNVWETIWSVLSVVMEGIWETIKVAWELIVDVVMIAWDLISGIIEGATDIIMGIVQTFAALFTGNWSEMWEGIKKIIDGTWQIIVSILEAAIGLVVTVISKGLKLIWTAISTVFTSMWKFIETIFGLIVDYMTFAWDNSTKIASKAVKSIFKWVSDKFNAVKDTVSAVMDAVLGFIGKKFGEAVSKTITKVREIYTAVRDKFNEIKEGVSDKMNDVKETIENIWGKIMDFFENIDLKEIGKNIIDGLKGGIESKAKDLAKAAKGVVKGAVDGVKGFLGVASPSRLFKEIGVFTGQGFEIGMTSMRGKVAKAAQGLAGAAEVDAPQVSMSYATAGGIKSSLASAVNGTVDINSSGGATLSDVVRELRVQRQMIVELDGQQVGQAVTPHVNNKNAIDSTVRRYF